jgi:osmotically-inducible protein OsmY
MRPRHALLLTLLAGAGLFQGCATAVVTGAATGAAVALDRRTPGTIIEDQTIEMTASSVLSDDPQLDDQAHLNVTSYNTVVLITGEAPTPALRARAEELVAGVRKVRRVVNEVTIAAPSSLTSRGSDTLITTKVKAALFRVKEPRGFDPLRVKVVSENGSVYLMGLVTRTEAQAVVDTVRRVGGVQRVVNVFDYIQ